MAGSRRNGHDLTVMLSNKLALVPVLAILGGGSFTLALDELDVRVQERLRDALLDDARIRSYALVIDVADGVATVQGVVGSTAARDAATGIARSVAGVRDVRNELIVRPDVRMPDGDIELYVQEALSRDPNVESTQITVTCLEGVVELYGTVDSDQERERAEKVASRVLGVAKVKNHLSLPGLEPPRQVSDFALTAAVEQALAPELPDVEVRVERGVVTLRGSVDSPAARERAEELAFGAGATLVRNELVTGTPRP